MKTQKLQFTKAGLTNFNRLVLWAFIANGYKAGIPNDKLAKKLGVKKTYIYKTACRLGFSLGRAKSFCNVTPEGIERGRRKRQQHTRNKIVPITLPGPDWAKRT